MKRTGVRRAAGGHSQCMLTVLLIVLLVVLVLGLVGGPRYYRGRRG